MDDQLIYMLMCHILETLQKVFGLLSQFIMTFF
jgi:hypothetical protein